MEETECVRRVGIGGLGGSLASATQSGLDKGLLILIVGCSLDDEPLLWHYRPFDLISSPLLGGSCRLGPDKPSLLS